MVTAETIARIRSKEQAKNDQGVELSDCILVLRLVSAILLICTYNLQQELKMASSTLTIRIDDDLKRQASEVADYYGLDLSSVTRAFYKQMVNTHRIPLTFAPEEPNAESLEAINEGNEFLTSGKKGRFANGGDLISAAMA